MTSRQADNGDEMKYKAIVVADTWDDGSIKEVILVPESAADPVLKALEELLRQSGTLLPSQHEVVVCKSVKDLQKKSRYGGTSIQPGRKAGDFTGVYENRQK
jgi:hypothetical protein